VLEAGGDHTTDINVLAPGLSATLYGNLKYDWDFHTVPQKHSTNRVIAQPRGRLLGGSSAINVLFWTHASRWDLDNWGVLGNEGWSWDEMLPYFRRSESLMQPERKPAEELELGYLRPELHGKKGPVNTSVPREHLPFGEAWPRTYKKLGQSVDGDPRDGLALGGYTNLLSMDSRTNERSFSATAYLGPATGRKNLKVVTNALVEKVVFAENRVNGKLVVMGVRYRKDNTSNTVQAKNEVLLCAGSYGSPHILELSGYGSQELLEKYGIPVLYDNPNVGENLQDHAMMPLAWEVKPGIFTYDNLRNATVFNDAYEQYLANRTGSLSTGSLSSALLSYDQILDPIHGKPAGPGAVSAPPTDNMNPDARVKQYGLLVNSLRDPHECIAQEIHIAGGISPQLANDSLSVLRTTLLGNFFTMLGVLEHPFSRGSVHLTSSDPTVYPAIDPNYLAHAVDAKVLGDIGLHVQKVAQTSPLSDLLKDGGKVLQEGYPVLTQSNKEDWVRKSLMSEYHPCGTCAMMPTKEGGVVDPRLKVYGTTNLRVVDASIFPLIPRANLQTLVYAVAERAVEWIKEDAA
jgi:choline dehydrogenase